MGSIFAPISKLKELLYQTKTLTSVPIANIATNPVVLASWRIIRPTDVIAQPVQCSMFVLSGSGKGGAVFEGFKMGWAESTTGLIAAWNPILTVSYDGVAFVHDSSSNGFGGTDIFLPTSNFIAIVAYANVGNTLPCTIQELDAYLSFLLPLGHAIVRLT